MGHATTPLVLKFGGTSVEDAAAFERAIAIVRARTAKHPVVVVVSALSKVTDALFRCIETASAEPFAAHIERHRAIAERLLDAEQRAGFERELAVAGTDIARLVAQAPARADRHVRCLSAGVRTTRHRQTP